MGTYSGPKGPDAISVGAGPSADGPGPTLGRGKPYRDVRCALRMEVPIMTDGKQQYGSTEVVFPHPAVVDFPHVFSVDPSNG